MNPYLILAAAILCEVIATTALKASESFTKWAPSVVVVLGYGCSFYLLSLCLRSIPVGVAYAVWCGVGIVLIAALGVVIHGQRLDLPAAIGMALIIAGVAVMQLFSKMNAH